MADQIIQASLGTLLAALTEQPIMVAYARDGVTVPLITAITDDSRVVAPGTLFVAEVGRHTDGHQYATTAIERGAVAVLVEHAIDLPEHLLGHAAIIVVPHTRPAAADLAAALYGYPARTLHVTGVTGTDGKTTTTTLVSTLLDIAGDSPRTSGFLGTAQIKVGDRLMPNPTRFTTPKAPQIQETLARVQASGASHVVIESSSHALALDRLRHCDFRAAIVTNITSEHLDFHQTQEAYVAAKARLFSFLDQTPAPRYPLPRLRLAERDPWPKVAILNRDDASYQLLAPHIASPLISYGIDHAEADVWATRIVSTARGSAYLARTPVGEQEIFIPVPGRFNVANSLAVLALGISQGVPLSVIVHAMETFAGVPGRMQRVDVGQPFTVIVDYAHTPDSLAKVIETIRPLTRKRVIIVFGSAGERDRQKRPLMGAVAARQSDFFVLTDEDPRLEDSRAILEEIATGARAAGAREGSQFLVVPNRRAAVRTALLTARPGDSVVLAGKGHERSMIVGTESQPWDEVEVARTILVTEGLADE